MAKKCHQTTIAVMQNGKVMSRYIDADALLKELHKAKEENEKARSTPNCHML